MSLNFTTITTPYASVIIALKYCLAPTSVLWGVAFFIAARLTKASVLTWRAAILGFQVTAFRLKLFTAPLANKLLPFAVLLGELGPAGVGACTLINLRSKETCPAYCTRSAVAAFTVENAGIACLEFIPAQGAFMNLAILGLLDKESVTCMLPAKISLGLNLVSTSGMWAKFTRAHTFNYTRICAYVERWSTATGKEPCRL